MTGSRTPEDYQIEDFVTDESFINYFFRLNTEDMAFWTNWLAEHPRNAGLAEEAKEMLRTLSLTLPEAEFAVELSRMREAIHEETKPVTRRRPAIFRLLRRGEKIDTGMTAAGRGARLEGAGRNAIVLVLLLLAIAPFLWTHIEPRPDRLIAKTNDSGKPVVFTLSDGTVVTLAPGSILRYPAAFGAGDRKLILEGEAQFRVSRNEAHPFKVYEGDIVATVLGTVFHVKEQTGDSAIQVELISGKLRVETIQRPGLASQSILLDPDERVVYLANIRQLTKERWQSQHEPMLVAAHLVFRKNNFDEIAQQFKTLFGLTIVNQSNKKNWRFTGDFVNAGPAEIMENICLVEGLHSETAGDTITIK